MVDSIHDMGGMHGFGPIEVEQNEPLFHADWERDTYRMMMAYFSAARTPPDQFRYAIERMDPVEYLESSYYERWLTALETLLREQGVPNPQDDPQTDSPTSAAPDPVAMFKAGDKITARIMHPAGHTRLPRYVRGRAGVVERDWGVYTFPDAAGTEGRIVPMRLYLVRFSARELWGEERAENDTLRLDLFEAYLEAER